MKGPGREGESPGSAEMSDAGDDDPQHCSNDADPEESGDASDDGNFAVQQEHSQAAAQHSDKRSAVRRVYFKFTQKGNGSGKAAIQRGLSQCRPEISGVLRYSNASCGNGKRSADAELPD